MRTNLTGVRVACGKFPPAPPKERLVSSTSKMYSVIWRPQLQEEEGKKKKKAHNRHTAELESV